MALKPRKRPGRRAVIDMRAIMERCANIYGAAGCLRFLDEQAGALWGCFRLVHCHWSPGSMLVNEQWTHPFPGPFRSPRNGQMSVRCGRNLAHSED